MDFQKPHIISPDLNPRLVQRRQQLEHTEPGSLEEECSVVCFEHDIYISNVETRATMLRTRTGQRSHFACLVTYIWFILSQGLGASICCGQKALSNGSPLTLHRIQRKVSEMATQSHQAALPVSHSPLSCGTRLLSP